ncbi:hypothetical protein TELCIR_12123, partial [Teladorsagia circumcincta]
NEPQQYLMLNAWIVERWVDNLLGWDPTRSRKSMFGPSQVEDCPNTAQVFYLRLVMDDQDTRRLLNAKLTTRGKDKGALVELLYPTIYKLSCLLDLRFFPFDVQTCKLTFGSWTFDNTLIDYFPHNITHAIGITNCIDNEGWTVLKTTVQRHYSCYCVDFDLLCSPPYSACIRSRQSNDHTCATAGVTAPFFGHRRDVELSPRKIKSRVVRRPGQPGLPSLQGQEDKLRRAQDGRKQSLWQRVYRLAREQGQIRKQSNTLPKVNGVSGIGSTSSPDIQQLQVPKKSCTINTDVTCINEQLSISGDTSALVEFSNMSDEDNSSFPDIDFAAATPATPVSKFHSLHKMSTCASLDSMIRNVDMSVTSPRTIQRNLAELEYDWLAAVIERIFLIFFIIVFLLTSVGINCIGLYYWYVAQNDPHFGFPS